MTLVETPGEAAARASLARLLRRAEAAAFRDVGRVPGEAPPSSALQALGITPKAAPEYFRLPSHEDRRQYHAAVRRCHANKAISLEWDEGAGPSGQLKSIAVIDAAALAAFLAVQPAWARVDDACAQLQPWMTEVPAVSEYAHAWRDGRRPRGVGPEDHGKVVAACRVLHRLRANASRASDLPVRRLSIELFQDSKFIEQQLTKVLDSLTGGDERDDGDEDVLERLGLLRYPQAFHIAGHADIRVGGAQHTSAFPYSAFAPDQIEEVRPFASESGILLSIENLATFNELARHPAKPVSVVLLYTGGMPSPAHVRTYRGVLRSLPATWAIAHWGDVDLGGFRIARHLAKAALTEGRRLTLKLMEPRLAGDALRFGRRELSTRERDAMVRICDECGWRALSSLMAECTHAVEQEATAPDWAQLVQPTGDCPQT